MGLPPGERDEEEEEDGEARADPVGGQRRPRTERRRVRSSESRMDVARGK